MAYNDIMRLLLAVHTVGGIVLVNCLCPLKSQPGKACTHWFQQHGGALSNSAILFALAHRRRTAGGEYSTVTCEITLYFFSNGSDKIDLNHNLLYVLS